MASDSKLIIKPNLLVVLCAFSAKSIAFFDHFSFSSNNRQLPHGLGRLLPHLRAEEVRQGVRLAVRRSREGSEAQ